MSLDSAQTRQPYLKVRIGHAKSSTFESIRHAKRLWIETRLVYGHWEFLDGNCGQGLT